MNALRYLSSLEISFSSKDDEYSQNVSDFIRCLIRKVHEGSIIEESYLHRVRELLIKHGVMWGVSHRKVDKIAKWINSFSN